MERYNEELLKKLKLDSFIIKNPSYLIINNERFYIKSKLQLIAYWILKNNIN